MLVRVANVVKSTARGNCKASADLSTGSVSGPSRGGCLIGTAGLAFWCMGAVSTEGEDTKGSKSTEHKDITSPSADGKERRLENKLACVERGSSRDQDGKRTERPGR